MMVIGGIFALVFSTLRPHVYEATAKFNVSIDYTQTGALTDIQEDQVMRNIGYILESDKVMEGTFEKTKEINCVLSRKDLDNQTYLDRRDASWFLRVRSEDPQCAMNIANSWAEEGYALLQEGLYHAQIVDANNRLLLNLKSCLTDFESSNLSNNYPCGFSGYDEIEDQIVTIGSIIKNEKQLSEGLMPALTIDLINKAVLPTTAVQNNRNLLVFSGLAAGFFSSLFVLLIRTDNSD
jgi:hypothetical protein